LAIKDQYISALNYVKDIMKDNNRVMPLLLRAEKIGEMIKKMDSENILTP
jgi:hypothetical protein